MAANRFPEIVAELIPTKGMRQDGIQHRLFIKLWTLAGDWPNYTKREWMELDQLLFAPTRTAEEKRQLAALVTRLWTMAAEQQLYDEDDWRALRKLIQEPVYGT
jgi:hypothetical protein